MTRQTAAINVGPATTGQNAHAPPPDRRGAPLLPRTMPVTGPGSMKPPAARSTPRTGPRRPRPIAGLPARRTLRTRGKQPAPRSGWRSARPPLMGGRHRPDAHDRRTRTRLDRHRRQYAGAGRATGTAGDAGPRGGPGAVTVSDRPGGGPVPGPARTSARNAGTRTAGQTDGTGTHRGSARQPLSDQERAAMRQAGAEDARRSRAEHGFPERIEDPAAVAVLAALLRAARLRRATKEHAARPHQRHEHEAAETIA